MVGTDTVRVQTEKLTDADEPEACAGRRWPRRSASPSPSVTASFIGPSWGAVGQQARRCRRLVVFLLLVVAGAWRSTSAPGRWRVAALIALAARPRHHRRHLRPGRLRGHPGVGDRLPHHPRLLASTTPSSCSTRCARTPPRRSRNGRMHLLARRPTWRSTRPWSARSTPRSSALLPIAAILVVGFTVLGPGTLLDLVARAVRRHRDRHLLLDLHRHAAAGRPARARAGDEAAAQAGRALPGDRTAGAPQAAEAGRRPARRGRRQPGGPSAGRRTRRPCRGRRRDASTGRPVHPLRPDRPAQPAPAPAQVQALRRHQPTT